MRLRNALSGLELLYTAGLLAFALSQYLAGVPLSKEMFLSFIFYPFSVFAALLLFAYYVSVKFGKSIITYGVVLGLALGLAAFAVRIIPLPLSLGLAICLGARLASLSSVKELKELKASQISGDMVSLQIASLVALALFREIGYVLGSSTAPPLLFGVIIVWYLFSIARGVWGLAAAFGKWSRSESE